MKNYEALAKDIVRYVGGEENVLSLAHCITRLRFKLRDEAKANTDALKNLTGVVTVIQSGGQYQVVIGNEVADVYDAVLKVSDIKGSAPTEVDAEPQKLSPLDKFIDLISGIFTPILAVLIASGMIKGFTSLFLALHLFAPDSGTASMLQIVGDSFFYFLPIFLGLTAARKFKMNEFTGMAIGAALVYPTLANIIKAPVLYELFQGTIFASAVHMEFLGMPVILMNYASSVIPIVVSLYFGAKVERRVAACIPSMLKNFMTPFITLLIVIPLTFLLFGPVATWAGQIVGAAALAIYSFSPVIAGLFIGTFWQVCVIFGLHWGLVPIMLNNIIVYGFDPLIITYFGASFAQIGVVLAIILRTKDMHLRAIAIPAFISGVFGVTEPCIYGITLPRKKYFIISCIGGGIGGAIMAFFTVRLYVFGGLGIFGYPCLIDPATGNLSGMQYGIVASLVAFAVGLGATLVLYQDEKKVEAPKVMEKLGVASETIVATLSGRVVALKDVPDEAFAAGLLGQGAAIEPTEGLVRAPADGTVTTLFPTGHAVGLVTNAGAEILVHIGMDTVQMEGKGFKTLIQQGDPVKKGQPLIEFDLEAIKQAGHPTITPVLVTNAAVYTNIIPTEASHVTTGDNFLQVIA